MVQLKLRIKTGIRNEETTCSTNIYSLNGYSAGKRSITIKSDSLSIWSHSLHDGRQNNKDLIVYENAKLDIGTYFTLLGDDLKQQLTFPFHAIYKDWLKVGKLAFLTGAVALINRPVNQFALKLHNDSKAVANISKYTTEFGGAYEVYAIAGFYAYGLIFKSEKQKTTTALATQAYITASVISTLGKYLSGKQDNFILPIPTITKTVPFFMDLFMPSKRVRIYIAILPFLQDIPLQHLLPLLYMPWNTATNR